MSAAPKPDLKLIEPPMLDQIEETLLGSIIWLPDLLSQYALESADFALFKNRWVFEAIQSLAARQEAISEFTVKAELDSLGTLAKIGDPDYAHKLSNRAMELSGGQSIALTAEMLYRRVKEASRQHKNIDLHTQAVNAVKNQQWAKHGEIVAQLAALAQPSGAPQFQLLTYDDLRDLPPVSYLDSSKELVCGGFNVLYARRGAGKSSVALDYSLTIAQERPVVYVAGEGKSGYPDRIAAWMNHHKKSAGQFKLIDRAVKVLVEEDLSAFIASVAPVKPALVVLDTLARCFVGGDENNTADMTRFIEACNRIQRNTGAAVLVLHHTGKATNGTRGSIVLEDAADMVISLTNEDGSIKLSCDKSKDSEAFPARYLRLMTADARPGNRACVVMPSEQIVKTTGDLLTAQEVKILETLALKIFDESGAAFARLHRATEIPETSLNRKLSELKALGYVRQAERGEPYYITDHGKSKLSEHPKTFGSSQKSKATEQPKVSQAVGNSATKTASQERRRLPEQPKSNQVPSGSSAQKLPPTTHLFRDGGGGGSAPGSDRSVTPMSDGEIITYGAKLSPSIIYAPDLTGAELASLHDAIPRNKHAAFEAALDRAGLLDKLCAHWDNAKPKFGGR